MSGMQIAYAIALAGLFAWRGPSLTAWVLLGNMVAALVGCLAMDWGLLGRSDATLTMMLIDFVSAAILVTQPGLPRVIAAGYAATIPLYSLSIMFSVAESTTFAIVIGIGFAQLAVAGIGAGGDDRGNRGRFSDVGYPVSVSGRNSGMGAGGLAQGASLLSPDRRRLN
jgi:hypothetical protein